MFNSMTGYGRAQETVNGKDISVEMKAVNHRYFECNARLPRAYGYLEEKLKALLNTKIARGKVEVGVTIFSTDSADTQVSVNEPLARSYIEALRSLGEPLGLSDTLSLSTLTRFSDIFQVTKVPEDEDAVWKSVKQVAEEALERFLSMRKAEGARLYDDIRGRLNTIEAHLLKVEEYAPQTVADYKARLTAKIEEVLENRSVDEARVLTEVALFADKIAVDEETVRLRSHLKQFASMIDSDQPTGRKIDFLVQEMNREVNTIGSKCQDLRVTNLVVEMKAEIEKIREQIQNVE